MFMFAREGCGEFAADAVNDNNRIKILKTEGDPTIKLCPLTP
jgi:hypothetical protein